MSATDELRMMLDEHGIEWMPCAWEPQTETFYKNGNGVAFIATESLTQDYVLLRTDMPVTPAQAIAATVGTGTCQVDTTESWLPAERYHRCKHCGAFFAVLDASSDIPPRFCPNCGRRIEVDE